MEVSMMNKVNLKIIHFSYSKFVLNYETINETNQFITSA